MKSIFTEKAPAVLGPYSQAIEVNGFIFCAGQIGLVPSEKKLATGLENEVRQIMTNIEAVLIDAGSDLSKIVKTTIFLIDMDHYKAVNEIYGSYFPGTKPARSVVAVASLPAGAMLEIECIAVT